MRSWLILVCLLVSGATATAAPVARPDYSAELAKGVARGFPAMVLLVDDGAGHVWRGAAGSIDLDKGTRAKTSDAYHLASITKVFTAVATLRLADQGKIDLDRPMSAYLDASVIGRLPYGDRITVRQLLDHSSGLYSFNNNLDYVNTLIGPRAHEDRTWTARELIALAENPANKPFGPPGEGHHYGDTNYVLLQLIIEKVTGETLKAHVTRTIFRPLGMAHSWYYTDRFRRPGPARLAHGYLKPSSDLAGFVTLDPALRLTHGFHDTTWAGERLDASAGIVSTADDLRRFGRALFDARLLSARSQAWMMSVGDGVDKLKPGKDHQAVLRAFNTPLGTLITANGDGPDTNTALAYDPKTGAVLIAFTNVFGYFDENDFLRETVFQDVLADVRRRRGR